MFVLSFSLMYAGFAFLMHTPWYAAAQLKFAYRNHNIAMLTKVVDIPSVISGGYDDVTGDLFIYNSNMPPAVRQIFRQFYQLIKKTLCSGTLQTVNGYLADDVWGAPTGTSVLKGRELGIDYDELLERSMMRNTAVRRFGSLMRDEDGNFVLPVIVADRYTSTDFELKLLFQRTPEGMWRVVKIANYHDYLIHVRDLCNSDIASYIKDTKEKTAEYNSTFQSLQLRFQALTKDAGPGISQEKRNQIQKFIVNNIIPAYKAHEDYLQNVNVPSGALHLHVLRLQSNAKTIEAWQNFAKGISDNSAANLAEAERDHQAALVLEQKVSDIINKMPALFVPEIP